MSHYTKIILPYVASQISVNPSIFPSYYHYIPVYSIVSPLSHINPTISHYIPLYIYTYKYTSHYLDDLPISYPHNIHIKLAIHCGCDLPPMFLLVNPMKSYETYQYEISICIKNRKVAYHHEKYFPMKNSLKWFCITLDPFSNILWYSIISVFISHKISPHLLVRAHYIPS